ncbi:hypothetical protein LEP1GSC016_3394 [Leptospira borgpetersenii serovar Hardjo-bovis str. Sponselee]|uniref:Uncharacterized protein n=1 Tax=Leptospira borgpetersenii serovar Hardjo-bovis str. Sponselee TaxID=1303729 RepID=M6BXH1_LEPBO|nr:hypothetical protein LEP1GSC016_3394 [Leptospira borgpetersenii serovar Hardjo-bovis str. Sponselee]
MSYYSKVDKEWANNPHVKSQIRKCLNNLKSIPKGKNLRLPARIIENTERVSPVSIIPTNEGISSGLEEIKDQISNVQWITFLNLGILLTLLVYSVFFRKR